MSRTHRVVLLATFVAVAFPLASVQPAPARPLILPTQSAMAVGSASGAATAGQQGGTTTTVTEKSLSVQMIVKGLVHLGSTLDEIEVGPGGRFVIQEITSVDEHLELEAGDPEHGRRLEITAGADGDVERAWTIDGVTSRLDDDARDWIDGILVRLGDAHVELSPVGSDETRTLIFTGEHLAMVGEAHVSAGASSHGVIAVTEGDRVLHIKPGMVWRAKEGKEGSTIELRIAKPIVTEEGTTIDLHLARPLEVGEDGEWTIHIDDADLLLHEGELAESIHVELEKLEGGESFTVVVPELKVLGEGDERKVRIVVPEGHRHGQETSTIVVKPNVRIVEEAGEGRAVVVVEPNVVIESEALAEAMAEHNVRIAIAEKASVDPVTIVIERADDDRHRHSMRIRTETDDGGSIELSTRGEVELGKTVDEIEVEEDGELTIDARDADGVIRQLSVRRGADGDLLFEFHVDGEERPFDEAARAWLQGVLDHIES